MTVVFGTLPANSPVYAFSGVEPDTTSPQPVDAPAADGAGGGSFAAPDTVGALSLSPDGILAYCQARLDSVQGQVDDLFTQQQTQNNEATQLQQVIATIQAYGNGVAKTDPDPAGECTAMETALYNYIQQISASDPNFPDLGKLKQAFNDLLYTGTGPQGPTTYATPSGGTVSSPALDYIDPGAYPPNQNGPQGDKVITSDEVQGFVQSLQGVNSDLNSGAQMQMIQLQSLMSQQQTAVELSSNIMQTIGDESEKIAENVGH